MPPEELGLKRLESAARMLASRSFVPRLEHRVRTEGRSGEAGTVLHFDGRFRETLPATAPPAQQAASVVFDGDGKDNQHERTAGPDAANSAGFLRVTQRAVSGSTFSAAFPTVPGRTCQIQPTPNPASAWTSRGSAAPGTGGNQPTRRLPQPAWTGHNPARLIGSSPRGR